MEKKTTYSVQCDFCFVVLAFHTKRCIRKNIVCFKCAKKLQKMIDKEEPK